MPYIHWFLMRYILMQVYGKPDLTGKVAIDVGAAIGDTALFFKKCGAKSVYGYELNRARVRIAEKNIEMNGMGNSVIVYNKKATVEELQKLMTTVNDPVFLKLDCEGCEYDIVPSLDMSKVKQTGDGIPYEARATDRSTFKGRLFRHTPRQKDSDDKS